MASGDTKTQQYLDIAARGTRADLQRGCCNTRTQDLIMDVAERIVTEEETRYREDQILQSEIDEIKNNPDVFDIVPTYAALQAYDTSQLTDKDIIRVLADETHDGASTYYRWSTQTQAFTYIGEVGDYYTREQIDDLLDEKQDELTAGDNITIEDESGALVISATDTTYSNFTGTDGTAAGVAGLVPAPATTDAGKFLKADGTWEAISGNSDFKVLSSADYNYPANNPTAVALWLLPPGVYIQPSPALNVYANNVGIISSYTAGTFIVGSTKEGRIKILAYGASGDSTAMLYSTNVADGSKDYVRHLIDETRIVDTLTSSSTEIVLPAKTGKTLNDKIEGRLITNAGAPTTATVGTVGQLLEDTANGKLYICTDTTGGSYTWVEVGAGGGGGGATELTSADYNWPTTGTKTSVNLLLLPDASYEWEEGVSVGTSANINTGGGYAVVAAKNSTTKMVLSWRNNGFAICEVGSSSTGIQESGKQFLVRSSVIDNLTSTYTDAPLSANQGRVLKELIDSIAIRGAGAPTTSTVGQVGTLYEDTTNGDLYICTDATNPYVWEEVGAGGGSGPTVVQAPGTSTTDVMSQNAVTSMIFADPATQYKIKIGAGTSTSEGTNAVEIGHSASATGQNGIAIGNTAAANTGSSISIGPSTIAGSSSSVAIGSAANVKNTTASNSIAIGTGTKASNYGAIALGAYSGGDNMAQGEMNIGTSATYLGYNNSNYRLLTGLYDPQNAHDAATKGYVDPTTDSSAPTTATVGRLGQIQIDTTTATAYMCVAVDTVTPVYTWKQITA